MAFLEGQRQGEANLKRDLMRRIKMLEFALQRERLVDCTEREGGREGERERVCVCVCVRERERERERNRSGSNLCTRRYFLFLYLAISFRGSFIFF